jgi:tetratricopeptide (TPR) repeat protein
MAMTERLSAELQLEPRVADTYRLTRLYADGRFEEMDALEERVKPLAPTSKARADQRAAIVQSMVRFTQGRGDENLQLLEALAERFPLPVAWHCGLVANYAYVGRLDDAKRELDRLAAGGFNTLPDDHNWIGSMALLALAVTRLQDTEKAERLYAALEPYAARVVMVGIAGPSTGTVEQVLGQLAGCLGRHDVAIAHIERAIPVEDALGLRISAAWARLALAEVLLSRGAEGDAELAAERVREADAFIRSRSLGMLQAWADRLAQQLG